MKTKIIILILLIFSLSSSAQKQVSIYGKYYDIEDEKATHYVEFKKDGTFYHYYKKGKLVRSHAGEWNRDGKRIDIYNWEEYSLEYLHAISGFGKVKFGTKLANQNFWIDGCYLNTTSGEVISLGSYIKEENLEKIIAGRKKQKEQLERYLSRKDTFYYPNSRIIKDIGIEEEDFDGKKTKKYNWKHFYTTGELESEGGYSFNNKEGVWSFYYKNGKLKDIGVYDDCQKSGMWAHYHENGKLKERGVYVCIEKEGIDEIPKNERSSYYLTKKRGVWEYYNDKGKLINKKVFASREKYYDSLYVSRGDDKGWAIGRRKETIKREDEYYKDRANTRRNSRLYWARHD